MELLREDLPGGPGSWASAFAARVPGPGRGSRRAPVALEGTLANLAWSGRQPPRCNEPGPASRGATCATGLPFRGGAWPRGAAGQGAWARRTTRAAERPARGQVAATVRRHDYGHAPSPPFEAAGIARSHCGPRRRAPPGGSEAPRTGFFRRPLAVRAERGSAALLAVLVGACHVRRAARRCAPTGLLARRAHGGGSSPSFLGLYDREGAGEGGCASRRFEEGGGPGSPLATFSGPGRAWFAQEALSSPRARGAVANGGGLSGRDRWVLALACALARMAAGRGPRHAPPPVRAGLPAARGRTAGPARRLGREGSAAGFFNARRRFSLGRPAAAGRAPPTGRPPGGAPWGGDGAGSSSATTGPHRGHRRGRATADSETTVAGGSARAKVASAVNVTIMPAPSAEVGRPPRVAFDQPGRHPDARRAAA